MLKLICGLLIPVSAQPYADSYEMLEKAGNPPLYSRGMTVQQEQEEMKYYVVANQLIEDECLTPKPRQEFLEGLRYFVNGGLESQEELHLKGPEASFFKHMEVLFNMLTFYPFSAFECPMVMTSQLRLIADNALFLGQRERARVLLQIGNMFKLMAMSRWFSEVSNTYQKDLPPEKQQRFQPRMQMEYSLGLSLLTNSLLRQPKPYQRWPSNVPAPKIDILSLCVYKPDPTSNTVLESPLPQMTPLNHKAFASKTRLKANRYVLHTDLLLPDQPAHFSKFLIVSKHLKENPDIDWVFFVDCDAFFTDFDTSVADLIATYMPEDVEVARLRYQNINNNIMVNNNQQQQLQQGQTKTQSSPINFLVAEDTGGINTGVFMMRNREWSQHFLHAVTSSVFSTAWDQSMFFMASVNQTLFGAPTSTEIYLASQKQGESEPPPNTLLTKDFELPPEILFLHQSRLNAFVPPASKDWQAYEWQPGDFVKHFAGCPWQEKPCLTMMEETMSYVRDRWVREELQQLWKWKSQE